MSLHSFSLETKSRWLNSGNELILAANQRGISSALAGAADLGAVVMRRSAHLPMRPIRGVGSDLKFGMISTLCVGDV